MKMPVLLYRTLVQISQPQQTPPEGLVKHFNNRLQKFSFSARVTKIKCASDCHLAPFKPAAYLSVHSC